MTRLFTTIALTLAMSLGFFAFIAYVERDGWPGRRVGGGTRYTELLKHEDEIVKPLGQPLLKADLHHLTALTRRDFETATQRPVLA